MPEYRKLVKQFNDAGVVLMKHEVRVQLAWLFTILLLGYLNMLRTYA